MESATGINPIFQEIHHVVFRTFHNAMSLVAIKGLLGDALDGVIKGVIGIRFHGCFRSELVLVVVVPNLLANFVDK